MRYNLENEPVISIAMPVYNHEKYLDRALKSILDQKIDVLYEIVIGEDCSTDRSMEVIEQWMKKYPGKIRLLPREHNLGMHENSNRLLFGCRGKYIAWLDGDDYWLDDYKLQKQYSFLEGNPDYVGVASNITVVNAAGEPEPLQQKNYPLQKEGDFTLRDFEKGKTPGQTGTFFHKNIFREMNGENRQSVCDCHANGDSRIIGVLTLNGKIRIMSEVMSAYRFITSGGNNWNSIASGKNYTQIYYDKILELEDLLSNLSKRKVSLNVRRYHQIASALLTVMRSHKKEDKEIFAALVKKEKNKTGALLYCGRLAIEHILR